MAPRKQQTAMEYLYDSKAGTVLGRTAGSWFRILFFYLVYYAFLTFLMYGSVTMYSDTLESRDTPFIRTRTSQPGLSAIPANMYIEDDNNAEFKYDTTDDKTFDAYINRTTEFLEGYPKMVQSQFSRAILQQYYRDKTIVYFLKVNKINGWLPIPYKSPEEITNAGYHNKDKTPMLSFADNTFRSDGLLFACNATSEGTKIEFIRMEGRLLRQNWLSSSVGFVPVNKYEDLNKKFEDRRKWDEIGSIKAPIVAIKVTAGGVGTDNFPKREQITCFAIARNIQFQRLVRVGYYEFGFTAE